MTSTGGVDGSGAARDHKLWAIPLIVAMGLLSLLALSYLGSILDPQRNLHDFPMALVDADSGGYGAQVAAALPPDKVWLRTTDAAEAEQLLSQGQVYGAIVIPADFSARLAALEQPAADGGAPPAIQIRTNPRASNMASTFAVQLATPAIESLERTLSADAIARARTNGVAPSQAALVALGHPVRVDITEYDPLPPGTANGVAAFYYTLLIVFVGFTGSILINIGVDAATSRGDYSRWQILLFKWALIAVVALVMAAVYQVIATVLGMPIEHHLTLYFFSAFASLAVGMTALANLTLVATAAAALRAPSLNTLGMPINMLLFLALGLPSSGGIMPIEATPPAYRALARFEPMHQIYLGVRSILYFDARAAAGLTRAVVMCGAGTVFAIVVGVLATIGYERLQTRRARALTATTD